MNNEEFTTEELQEAERIENAIESLKHGKTPEANSAIGDSSLQTAAWFQGRTSSADIDPIFEERLQKELVSRFATNTGHTRSWMRFFVPIAGAAVVVIGVSAASYVALKGNDNATNTTGSIATANTNRANANTSTNGTVHTNANVTTNTNTDGETPTTNTNTATTEGNTTVDATFDEIDAQLAAVTPDLSEFTDINTSLQNTMNDIDDVLNDLDALDEATSAASDAVSQLDQLSI
jgi:hypothetical protein